MSNVTETPSATGSSGLDAPSLAECRNIGTSAWSDALDECAIEGVVRGLSQRAGATPFVGRAVTARMRVGKIGQFPKTDFGVNKILDATPANDVAVIDMDGADISTFGGMAALAASRKNIAAVIIDGGCRDLAEIRSSGLWLASRHVTPMTGSTRVGLESLGGPVRIGGVQVRQGDIIIGDETGIVVVPQADLARVLAVVRKKLAVDAILEEQIRAGRSFSEAVAKAKYM